MTAHKPIQSVSDEPQQLTLDIPGFDFTRTQDDISTGQKGRTIASDRPTTAAQLWLKLNL